MTKCDHCGQMLLTLKEFAPFSTDVVQTFVREYAAFLATGEVRQAAYATDERHEEQHWLDFIIYLMGVGRVELTQVRQLVWDIEEQVARIVPDTSGHKH